MRAPAASPRPPIAVRTWGRLEWPSKAMLGEITTVTPGGGKRFSWGSGRSNLFPGHRGGQDSHPQLIAAATQVTPKLNRFGGPGRLDLGKAEQAT